MRNANGKWSTARLDCTLRVFSGDAVLSLPCHFISFFFFAFYEWEVGAPHSFAYHSQMALCVSAVFVSVGLGSTTHNSIRLQSDLPATAHCTTFTCIALQCVNAACTGAATARIYMVYMRTDGGHRFVVCASLIASIDGVAVAASVVCRLSAALRTIGHTIDG